MGDEGAEKLGEVLAINNTLKTLDLQVMHFTNTFWESAQNIHSGTRFDVKEQRRLQEH